VDTFHRTTIAVSDLAAIRTRLLALVESLPEEHILRGPLQGAAWELLPREERYREPEHAGGPSTSGHVKPLYTAMWLRKLARYCPPGAACICLEMTGEPRVPWVDCGMCDELGVSAINDAQLAAALTSLSDELSSSGQ
jgi:hypothetical protein